MTVIVPVITIDGPSGVGKGTLCKALTKKLKWHLLDSGVIYRVLAQKVLSHRVAIDREDALLPYADHIDVVFDINCDKLKIILEGKDISQAIRNEKVGNIASQIATFPRLRELLLQRQRAFRVAPGLIADGRDMGTVVFPDAPVKFFLNASSEERTRRRMQQLQEEGFSVSFNYLFSKIQERDNRDRNRGVAPLMAAADALVIDSTLLTINEMIIKALRHVRHILKLS